MNSFFHLVVVHDVLSTPVQVLLGQWAPFYTKTVPTIENPLGHDGYVYELLQKIKEEITTRLWKNFFEYQILLKKFLRRRSIADNNMQFFLNLLTYFFR